MKITIDLNEDEGIREVIKDRIEELAKVPWIRQKYPEVKDLKIKVKRLKVGDLTDGRVIIERKSREDAIASIIDGRSSSQLVKMVQSGKRCAIIIEDDNKYTGNGMSKHEKMLSSYQIKYGLLGIIVLKVPNTEMLAYTALQLFLRANPEYEPVAHLVPTATPNIEPTAKALMQYEGIGEDRAIRIADGVYPEGMNKVVTLSAEQLTKIINPEAKDVYKDMIKLHTQLRKP